MDGIIVIAGAVVLIGFIVWWFFAPRKTSEAEATLSNGKVQEVTVVVNGGYSPNAVVLKRGVPAHIIFERKDSSGCFNEVVFPDFGVHEALPVGKKHSISIDTSTPGEYEYACGMNMFHGKVVIK